MSHEAGSLPDLVEKLVKNWEIEASFKTDLADWRTIDRSKYTFSVNGGPPQSGEHMLRVGTYSAIIESNEFYCPAHMDFDSSHKTFKRMMPNFAWEVLEVYAGPPTVAFRWRHWGVMKEDYTGVNKYVLLLWLFRHTFQTRTCFPSTHAFLRVPICLANPWQNSVGEKVTIKAHGGPIDIEGLAVAKVNDKLQLETVEVWFDPQAMFRQMKPEDFPSQKN